MQLNRTHLQLKVLQIEQFDWNTDNERRFCNYFLINKSIFYPHMLEEFAKRVSEFEKKWYGFSIQSMEFLIYAMTHWEIGKKAVVNIRIPKDDPRNPKRYLYDWVEKKTIDWQGMQEDLYDLALWCAHQVGWICKKNKINFSADAIADLEKRRV